MSYAFHHICVYYDYLYQRFPNFPDSSAQLCFLADNYYHLSAVDQYFEEIESLASSLHHPTQRTTHDSVAA